jgi:hypothetical protein
VTVGRSFGIVRADNADPMPFCLDINQCSGQNVKVDAFDMRGVAGGVMSICRAPLQLVGG